MNPKRQQLMRISGELLIEILKKTTNLPEDAELVTIIKQDKFDNTIRAIITSQEFPIVNEGEVLYSIDLYAKEFKEEVL